MHDFHFIPPSCRKQEKLNKMCKDGPVSIETFEHMNLLTLDNLMRSIYSLDTNCQTTG